MRRALAAALALLLASGPWAAAARLADPWPDPATAAGVRVEAVTFPSASPFTPAAWRLGDAPASQVEAQLFLPPSARAAPTVVLLHGAGGVIRSRGELYGMQLAAMGIAALVVDTFGARHAYGTSFTDRILGITETMFVADAYAALRWLAGRPEIDARRVVLTGFSYGG